MEEVVNLASLEGSVDFSMMGMFLKSDWVVKFVIILLVIFSIQSWKTIIQKILLINKLKKISKKFENHFWSGVSLDELYKQIDEFDQESFSNIFRNIMNEYEKSRIQKNKIASAFIQRLYTSLDLSIALSTFLFTSSRVGLNASMLSISLLTSVRCCSKSLSILPKSFK